MLHTVNKSPFQSNVLRGCLERLGSEGALLLIEDGVYGAVKNSPYIDVLQELTKRIPVYVLYPDATARGLTFTDFAQDIQTVDYGCFVDLVVEHGPMQAWL